MEVTTEWTSFALYFRIVKRCKKNPKCFVGVCEDPYYQFDLPVRNGEERVFSARNVSNRNSLKLEWKRKSTKIC